MPQDSGYLLPDDIYAPRTRCVFLCIPDDPKHIAAFWGQVYMLSYWWTWERDAAKQGTLAAQVWREIWHDARACWEGTEPMSDCQMCCDETNDLLEQILEALQDQTGAITNIINNQTYDIEINRETTYNTYIGAPTTIHPETPDVTYTEKTGDVPGDLVLREAALCYAIDAYTTHLWAQAQDYIAQTTGAAVAGAAGAAALFNPLAGIIVLVVGGALAVLANELTQAVFDDDDARQDVRCCMYSNLVGGVPGNHDAWRASLTSCGFTEPSNAALLANVIQQSLDDDTNWLVFLKAIGRGYELARDGLIETGWDRCFCPLELECWDFAGASRQGWINNEGTVFKIHDGGQQQSANVEADGGIGSVNGYVMTSYGSGSDWGCHTSLGVNKTVSSVRFRTYADAPGIGVPYWFSLWDENQNFITEISGTHAGATGWFDVYYEWPTAIDNVRYINLEYNNNWRISLDWLRINENASGVCP